MGLRKKTLVLCFFKNFFLVERAERDISGETHVCSDQEKWRVHVAQMFPISLG